MRFVVAVAAFTAFTWIGLTIMTGRGLFWSAGPRIDGQGGGLLNAATQTIGPEATATFLVILGLGVALHILARRRAT